MDKKIKIKQVSTGQYDVFDPVDLMKEFLKSMKGSDPLNDEVKLNDKLYRISSMVDFDGRSTLRLSVPDGEKVGVTNADDNGDGTYSADYDATVELRPDEGHNVFIRWEGASASEVVSGGEGRYFLRMNSLEKELIAVFSTKSK